MLMALGSWAWGQTAAPRAGRKSFTYPPDLPGAAATEIYKTAGDAELKIWIYRPEGHKPRKEKRPAIVFFFGGGFTQGSPAQFEKHCEYFASRGMVALTADYRVKSRHGASPVECVTDGKSAIRWVRANADRLGIDPDRIVGAGGSAGGFIAAGCGVVPGLDEEGEDASVSSVPDALVLFNPAWMGARVPARPGADKSSGGRTMATDYLPYHHVDEKLPPTIMFFGTDDRLLEGAQQFQEKARGLGKRCELPTWEGVGHGFFNHGRNENKEFRETIEAADRFLESLGYVSGEPSIK